MLKLNLGFAGLLEFSLQCFDALAWPLLALVYPLSCSIRAIEANSVADTQKLNSYWVVFSLILLFEHTFMKLLEWLPVWPYIRLVIVFCLVVPHFNGAFYVYKHLICPCLSMDLQIVINWFNKQKESSSKRENFLTEVERYVKENGPEGLEKIVASQFQLERTESNPNVKELKAVSSMENTEVSQTESNPIGTENCRSAIRDIKEKAMGAAEDREILQTPSSKEAHEWTCGISQVRQAEPNFTGTGNSKFTVMENIKEKAIEVAPDREFMTIIPPLKKVQKEWTSAISQVRTENDTAFNSHLCSQNLNAAYDSFELKNQANCKLTQIENRTCSTLEAKVKKVEVPTGREVHGSSEEVQKEWSGALCEVSTYHLAGKHEALYEELKVENQAYVTKKAPASVAKKSDKHEEPVNWTPSSGSKPRVTINEKVQGWENTIPASITKGPDKTKKPAEGVSSNGLKWKEKVQGQQVNPNEVPKMKDHRLWCKICSVHCSGKIDMASHLLGRKHKENVQEQQRNASSVLRKNDRPLWCKICNVHCPGKIDMASHLLGRKHKENVQEQQQNANSVLRKNDPLLWCKICDVGFYSEFDMECHLNGRRHSDNL